MIAAGALTHLATVVVTTPDGDTVPIPVLDGTLTFDDTRSPGWTCP